LAAFEEGLVEHEERRPFQKYKFTADYSPYSFRHQKNKVPKKGQEEEKVHACVGGDPLSSYLNNAAVKELLHIPAKIQPW